MRRKGNALNAVVLALIAILAMNSEEDENKLRRR